MMLVVCMVVLPVGFGDRSPLTVLFAAEAKNRQSCPKLM